jgi:PAS domain-containing protein
VIFNVRLAGEHWVQVSEHRTADGGTVILQTDVTDIIRAERHERGKLLDDQARVIRATLDHIDQGVGIFDAEARLVGWNQRLGTLLSLPMGGCGPGPRSSICSAGSGPRCASVRACPPGS